MTPFRASSGYKPPRSRQMPVSPDKFLCIYFNANLFKEITAQTNRYILKEDPEQHEPAVSKASNFVSPAVP
jgi:hypothetical protein